MIDPYYRVRSNLYRKRPAYGILLILWTAFMAFNAGLFGYYLFNVEASAQCYVRDGDLKPLDHTELLQP